MSYVLSLDTGTVSGNAMSSPDNGYEERIAAFAKAHREAEREARQDFLRTIRDIVAWTCGGVLCIGLALHTGDAGLGWIWYWLGNSIWFGGVSFSILAAYRRGERRGDW